jgi:biopolymer transport protein ExbB
MWPLLICSIVALSTVLERLYFTIQVSRSRDEAGVDEVLRRVEHHDLDGALAAARKSTDFVARVLGSALEHRVESFASAVMRAANQELRKFSRGLAVLDTIITLSPLLGLLGTVTGMIHSFNLLGGHELGMPHAITGGIAQALIATAFGLGIAITALIPFNFLNARLEEARREIEDAATLVELHLGQCEKCAVGNEKHPPLAPPSGRG